MLGRKLVKPLRIAGDKRLHGYRLTATGEAILRLAPSARQERLHRNLEALESWEIEMLLTALQRSADLMMDAE